MDSRNERTLQFQKKQRIFSDCAILIESLSGSMLDYMRIFSWNQEGGLLRRLSNYCSIFSQQSKKHHKEAQSMQRYANQAWLYCIECHDIIADIRNMPFAKTIGHREILYKHLMKIIKLIEQIAAKLPFIIEDFSNDENVIFFVLRHREDFDSLIRPGLVKAILKRCYSKGLKQTEKFLIDRYKERGFKQLLPIISENIQALHSL